MSTTPYWAQNLPALGAGYGKEIWFDNDQVLDQFDVTITNGGVDTSTIAISDASPPEAVFTNSATDNDSIEAQYKAETFRLNKLGGTYWFGFEAKIGDATQADLLLGLMKRDVTFIAGVSDGIFFRKDDGDTNLDLVSAKDAAAFPDDYSQSNGVGTVDTSYHEYVFRVVMDANTLGTGTITFYRDGVGIGSAMTLTTIAHDEELAISFGHQNGEGAAKALSMRRIMFWIPDVV